MKTHPAAQAVTRARRWSAVISGARSGRCGRCCACKVRGPTGCYSNFAHTDTGFPDSFCFAQPLPRQRALTYEQRQGMIGNAVSPFMSHAIGLAVQDCFIANLGAELFDPIDLDSD